jgi:hypothetical protein
LAMFGNAAKDSHPSGAEIKKAWGYISMAWFIIKLGVLPLS